MDLKKISAPMVPLLQIAASGFPFAVTGVVLKGFLPGQALSLIGTGSGIMLGRVGIKILKEVNRDSYNFALDKVVTYHRLHKNAKLAAFIGSLILGSVIPPLSIVTSLAVGVYHGLWLEAVPFNNFKVLQSAPNSI